MSSKEIDLAMMAAITYPYSDNDSPEERAFLEMSREQFVSHIRGKENCDCKPENELDPKFATLYDLMNMIESYQEIARQIALYSVSVSPNPLAYSDIRAVFGEPSLRKVKLDLNNKRSWSRVVESVKNILELDEEGAIPHSFVQKVVDLQR